MKDILISGIPISFPYCPYRSQLQLMNQIIKCLINSENAMLESPTGTGKTLAMLCSCLAWQRAFKASNDDESVPVIYYGTRTHKQIAQLVRQLKLTSYSSKIRMSILSSRKQTCIHPEVSKSNNLNEECRKLCKSTAMKCSYNNQKVRNHRELQLSRLRILCNEAKKISQLDESFNIEDMIRVGSFKHTCPYFLAKQLSTQSELVFCPYNFLIDPRVLSSAELNLNNSVVILDEAHNIDEHARECLSFRFNKLHLDEVMSELFTLIRDDYSCNTGHELNSSARISLAYLSPKLGYLLNWINNYDLEIVELKKRSSRIPVMDFVHAISEMGLGPNCLAKIKTHVSSLTDCSIESKEETLVVQLISDKVKYFFDELLLALDTIYVDNLKYIEDYDVVIEKEIDNLLSEEQQAIQLRLICNNAAVAFRRIDEGKIRSILVCSGTLAPVCSLTCELGVRFHRFAEADHIIDHDQVSANVVSHGPNGHALRCTYQNCSSFQFQDELGLTILSIARSVSQGGILVFVSSYRLMQLLIHRWRSTGLWQKLSQHRSLFSENNYKPLFLMDQHKLKDGRRKRVGKLQQNLDVVDLYKEAAQIPPGAILFGVFRGQVSEGIDFSDDTARCIITIGLPYPNLKEITVELKRKYNDIKREKSFDRCSGVDSHKAKEILSGDKWYDLQAFRALNQALGRCIRHKNDWGSLILIDERFTKNLTYVKYLSKWIRGKLKYNRDYNTFTEELAKFHNRMNTTSRKIQQDQQSLDDDFNELESLNEKHNDKTYFFDKWKEKYEIQDSDTMNCSRSLTGYVRKRRYNVFNANSSYKLSRVFSPDRCAYRFNKNDRNNSDSLHNDPVDLRENEMKHYEINPDSISVSKITTDAIDKSNDVQLDNTINIKPSLIITHTIDSLNEFSNNVDEKLKKSVQVNSMAVDNKLQFLDNKGIYNGICTDSIDFKVSVNCSLAVDKDNSGVLIANDENISAVNKVESKDIFVTDNDESNGILNTSIYNEIDLYDLSSIVDLKTDNCEECSIKESFTTHTMRDDNTVEGTIDNVIRVDNTEARNLQCNLSNFELIDLSVDEDIDNSSVTFTHSSLDNGCITPRKKINDLDVICLDELSSELDSSSDDCEITDFDLSTVAAMFDSNKDGRNCTADDDKKNDKSIDYDNRAIKPYEENLVDDGCRQSDSQSDQFSEDDEIVASLIATESNHRELFNDLKHSATDMFQEFDDDDFV
ncbi:hypothetical protein GJ496_008600 [Pomphorhynchus laevis]|nr:hypothetical protein GJ496_008600 [Pomphorhynchus laevis]